MARIRKTAQYRNQCGWGVACTVLGVCELVGRVQGDTGPLAQLTLGTALVVFASTAVGASLAYSGLTGTLLTAPLIGALRAIATALFIGAGVLQIARWRIDQNPGSGVSGTALLLYGAVVLPLASIASTMSANHPGSLFVVLTRCVTTLAVLGLIARALGTGRHRQDGQGRLLAQAAGSLTVALVGFCALALVHVQAGHGLSGRWLYVLLTASLAGSWFGAGALAVVRGQALVWPVRMAPVLTSMGVAELLRVPGKAVWSASAGLLVASIGVLAATAALRELMTAIRNEQEGAEALSDALDLAREQASQQHEWREEFSHDARNALSGLRATLRVLEGAREHLDEESLTRLRTAAIDELAHLEHMISAPATAMVDFDVADVIRAVVDLRRATGLEVALACPPIRGRGRPSDVARVVQNLLVNAQQHGRGIGVSVRVSCTRDHVEIQVADRGPGLSVGADPFARGVRGRDSVGSGLGLAVSRTLMREQGGDLVVLPRTSGATFTVRLPKAESSVEQPPVTLHRLPISRPVATADAS